MTRTRDWVDGARPRTLPAAIVPVAVGSAAAAHSHSVSAWRVVACLVVSLAIQVGTNYANDYSDGVRGTDSARVGPTRLVASGLAMPKTVLVAALTSYVVAGAVGLAVAAATSWWLVAVGGACLGAGWLYTGGPRPYGYAGLGELSVFLFFGLVATAGTTYVTSGQLTGLGIAAGAPVGLLAVALLLANNLRDRATDATVGKRTLAVRIGDRATRVLYVVTLTSPFIAGLALTVTAPYAALSLLAVPLAIRPARQVLAGATGRELIAVLVATGRLQLGFGALLTIGLVLP